MCRITIDGKAVVLSTGLYCQPEEWNSKKGEVKNNRLNGMLDEHKKCVDETYAELLKVNGVISAELLKNTITEVNSVPTMLLEAGEAGFCAFPQLGGHRLAPEHPCGGGCVAG